MLPKQSDNYRKIDFADLNLGIVQNLKDPLNVKGALEANNADFSSNLGGITSVHNWISKPFGIDTNTYDVIKYLRLSTGDDLYILSKKSDGSKVLAISEGGTGTVQEFTPPSPDLTLQAASASDGLPMASGVSPHYWEFDIVDVLENTPNKYLYHLKQHSDFGHVAAYTLIPFYVTASASGAVDDVLMNAAYVESTDGEVKALVYHVVRYTGNLGVCYFLLIDGWSLFFTYTYPYTFTSRTYKIWSHSLTPYFVDKVNTHWRWNTLPNDTDVDDSTARDVYMFQMGNFTRVYPLNTSTNGNRVVEKFDSKSFLPGDCDLFDDIKNSSSKWGLGKTSVPVGAKEYVYVSPPNPWDAKAPCTHNVFSKYLPISADFSKEAQVFISATYFQQQISANDPRITVDPNITSKHYAARVRVTFVTDDGQEFLPIQNDIGGGWGLLIENNVASKYWTTFHIQPNTVTLPPNVKSMRIYLAVRETGTKISELLDERGHALRGSSSANFSPAEYLYYDEVSLTDTPSSSSKVEFKPFGVSEWSNIYSTSDLTIKFFNYDVDTHFFTRVSQNDRPFGSTRYGVMDWFYVNTPALGVSLDKSLGYTLDFVTSETTFYNPCKVTYKVSGGSFAVVDKPKNTFIENKFSLNDVFSAMSYSMGKFFAVRKENGYITYSAVGTAEAPDIFPQENVIKLIGRNLSPIGIITDGLTGNLVVWDTSSIAVIDALGLSAKAIFPVSGISRKGVVSTPYGVVYAGNTLGITDFQKFINLGEVVHKYYDSDYQPDSNRRLYYNPHTDELYLFNGPSVVGMKALVYWFPRKIFSRFTFLLSSFTELTADPITGVSFVYDKSQKYVSSGDYLVPTEDDPLYIKTYANDYDMPEYEKTPSFLFLKLTAPSSTQWKIKFTTDRGDQYTLSGSGSVNRNYRLPRYPHRNIRMEFSAYGGDPTVPIVLWGAAVTSTVKLPRIDSIPTHVGISCCNLQAGDLWDVNGVPWTSATIVWTSFVEAVGEVHWGFSSGELNNIIYEDSPPRKCHSVTSDFPLDTIIWYKAISTASSGAQCVLGPKFFKTGATVWAEPASNITIDAGFATFTWDTFSAELSGLATEFEEIPEPSGQEMTLQEIVSSVAISTTTEAVGDKLYAVENILNDPSGTIQITLRDAVVDTWATGDWVRISGCQAGMTQANNTTDNPYWVIREIQSSTQFLIQYPNGNSVTGTGTYGNDASAHRIKSGATNYNTAIDLVSFVTVA